MAKKNNSNVLALGGLNSGKTDSLILPNILYMDSSYVISDPDDEIFTTVGPALLKNGYKIKTFTLNKPDYSCRYNPLDYIYDMAGDYSNEKAMIFAEGYAKNIHSNNIHITTFWTNVIKGVLFAAVRHMINITEPADRNLNKILEIMKDWAGTKNVSASIMATLDKTSRDNYKLSLEKLCTIPEQKLSVAVYEVISSLVNLLGNPSVAKLLTSSHDDSESNQPNIDMEKIGWEKSALFIDTDISDPYMKWITPVLFAQCYDTLEDAGEKGFQKWYVAHNDMPISYMFDTEEEAEAYRNIYMNSHVESNNGTICIKSNGKCLTYMYSEEAGNEYIKEFKESKILFNDSSKLIMPVRFIMKDIDHIGTIPQLVEFINTGKLYNITTILTARTIGQLLIRYGQRVLEIVENCKYIMYFGKTDPETCLYISSIIKSSGPEFRNFIIPDYIPSTMCIVVDRRLKPNRIRYEPKYDITSHRNYDMCVKTRWLQVKKGDSNAS